MTAVDSAVPAVAEPDEADPVTQHIEAPPKPADLTTLEEAQEVTGQVVVPAQGGGFLTFRADQTVLTPDQRAALAALKLDPDDDRALPHIMVFIHMCQKRGLDPWCGEAYLVKRDGKYDYQTKTRSEPTYTMQISINGYRSLAADTGRQIGGAEILWTGPDDDPDSWHAVVDERTGRVRKLRVWQDMWPDNKGYPGAALAVVTHYDDHGNVVTTEHVAHWEMYAPFKDEWEGPNGNRTKKLDANGNPVRVLTGKWADGGPAHMLGKCAEAGGLRKAFPRKLGGFYVTEEMDYLDAAERSQREELIAEQRREAWLKAMGDKAPTMPRPTTALVGKPAQSDPARMAREAEQAREPEPVQEQAPSDEHDEQGQQDGQGSEPVSVGDVLADAVPQASPEQRRQWLIAEVDQIGQIIGQDFRQVLTARCGHSPEEMDLEELQRWVGSFRIRVAPHLRAKGCGHNASVYEAWPTDFAAPLPVLFDTVNVPVDRKLGWTALEPAPEPHAFAARPDDEARCATCGGFEDDSWHTGAAA